MGSLIRLEKITRTFHTGEELKAVNNISLSIDKGEQIAVVGKSGSGKTTLLNILGLLDSGYIGKYYLDGEEIHETKDRKRAQLRNKKIGFVVQDYALIEHYNVLENVMLPLYYSSNKKEGKNRAIQLLKKLGLKDKIKEKTYNLSGGQRQRVAIARAIVNDPYVLLADEPTGALDQSTGEEVIELMRNIGGKERTVIMVTHDMEIAKKFDRIIEIKDGEIL